MNEIQILDVAKQLFKHFGPQKTTMKDIAERLSISPPYLMKFFEDKGTLILALIKSLNEDLNKSIEKKLTNLVEFNDMVDLILNVKTHQFSDYCRFVHSVSYLQRLGNLALIRHEFTINNSRIATLIMERTGKSGLVISALVAQGLLELLQEADHTVEVFMTKNLPHGNLTGFSFLPLFEGIMDLKNKFLKSEIMEDFNKSKQLKNI